MTLYDTLVPQFVKMLDNLATLLGKAESHCTAQGLAPEDIIQARFAPDMLPFAYQVKSACVHSIGAIEGARGGVFSPDTTTPPDTFASLREAIDSARSALSALDRAEIDALFGRPMQFRFATYYADFTVEQFLLTFSLPNFYFHVTTAYDLLRWKGLEIGKVDFLGAMQLRQ